MSSPEITPATRSEPALYVVARVLRLILAPIASLKLTCALFVFAVLLIFFGTLGGLFLFGLPGLLLGPILTALFVTIWEIYGVVFRDLLPQVQWLGAGPAASTPAARDPQEDDA